MKLDYTHVCVVLDASGSMESISGEVKHALAKFAKEQRDAAEKGEKIAVDIYQFSNDVKRLAHNAELSELSNLIESYQTGGSTALYDAVCTGIDELGQFFASLDESERPEDVVFVIVTDGYENASRHFSNAVVQARIKTQTETYNWQFVFLADGIDANESAADIGIKCDCAFSVEHDDFAKGVANSASNAMTAMRKARLSRRNK